MITAIGKLLIFIIKYGEILDIFCLIFPNFASVFVREIDEIDALKVQYLQALEDRLNDNGLTLTERIEQLNHYGTVLAQSGELKHAKVQFDEIIQFDSTFIPAWNNLGNIEFVQGNFFEAESLYQYALQVNPFSSGINLNLSLLYQMMMNRYPQDSIFYQQKSGKVIRRAAQLLDGKVEKAYSILGHENEGVDGKANSLVEDVKIQLEKVKSFLDICFKKYQKKQDIKNIFIEFYDIKGMEKTDLAQGEFLYWSQ